MALKTSHLEFFGDIRYRQLWLKSLYAAQAVAKIASESVSFFGSSGIPSVW